jgi:hypothetical protein
MASNDSISSAHALVRNSILVMPGVYAPKRRRLCGSSSISNHHHHHHHEQLLPRGIAASLLLRGRSELQRLYNFYKSISSFRRHTQMNKQRGNGRESGAFFDSGAPRLRLRLERLGHEFEIRNDLVESLSAVQRAQRCRARFPRMPAIIWV